MCLGGFVNVPESGTCLSILLPTYQLQQRTEAERRAVFLPSLYTFVMQHYKWLIFRSVSSEESAQYFVVSCDSIDLVLQQGPTKPSTDIANLRI